MRKIKTEQITKAVKELSIAANIELRSDVLASLKQASKKETNSRAKKILSKIIENAQLARQENLAICQDTGLPVVFVELGEQVEIIGGDLRQAINRGIEQGYKNASFRNSIIKDPLFLRGKACLAPTVIHFDIVKGNKLKITVLPKGFGSENKTKLKMFNPTVGLEEIKNFIIEAVKEAGPDACPPYIVGVGIGGTADYAGLLAKKALLKKIKNQKSKIKTTNQNSKIEKLEETLLKEVNKLNIGPMGLGGKTTALAVKVSTYPTHIAGLPVCVNISCHATRSASVVI
ncbi:MAG: fumarate hydratase [Candidatus Omnitrophota bacterium]